MNHLKLFNEEYTSEQIRENLVPIATNQIYWGWNDDATDIKATLYFDPTGSNKLYLHIRRTQIKLGIGKGEYPRDLVDYEPVGIVDKPDYKKIREYLTKHKYSEKRLGNAGGGPFKRKWTDIKGEQLALSDIINNSRYLKMVNLKNKLTKPKSPEVPVPDIPNIPEDINIIKYKDGYVIYGPGTIALKDDIKALGAVFNFKMKHPKTGERLVGWAISPRVLDAAKTLTGVQYIQESYSPEELFNLKQDIISSFSNIEIIKLFPKIYDDFFEIIIDDADLSYLKNEDPDELEFNFAEALQVYVWDYNSNELEITFLKSYLREKEFRISPLKKSYDDLDDNSQKIYDILEQRLETIFWELLEKSLGNM